ncbi:thiopeptide-type bacteriocin biosynthesis protein [Parapedobacter luteus]|uniref:thiopeptide-type bacteriocin biosynthesis protein n=1 Tax=Parapedobacter luteus TaxID=623280 RepID=UPI0021CF0654|nr:thiopeptide-type bacteriocin biosynthesis protein [Parapedobacter luteus]
MDRPIKEAKSNPISESKIKRTFQPGSEWAYIKVYCGVMESERVLRDQISSLINALKNTTIMEKWFFIRYNDPDPHIRLRFLLKETDGRLPFQQLIECLNQHLALLVENGTVHRIAYDTYERELERYGMESMEVCESIFHMDSESILSLLPLFKKRDGKHLRWLTGMLGVDHLFTAFGLDITKKIALATSLRDAFLDEFSSYNKLKYKLDIKYRESRHWIEKFLGLEHEDAFMVHGALAKRFESISQVSEALNHMKGDVGKCFNLLPSLSHMHINRLFPTSQREHEMVIYHLLSKHYMSAEKRGKPECSSMAIHR